MADDKQRQLLHVYLLGHGDREDFISPRSGGGGKNVPQRDRAEHARRLEEMLTSAVALAEKQIAARDPAVSAGTPGFYLEIEVLGTQQAVLDQLEYRGGKDRIELVAAKRSPENPEMIQATVFVPESKRDYYLHKVQAYAEEDIVRFERTRMVTTALMRTATRSRSRVDRKTRLWLLLSRQCGSHRWLLSTRMTSACFPKRGRKFGGKFGCGQKLALLSSTRPWRSTFP